MTNSYLISFVMTGENGMPKFGNDHDLFQGALNIQRVRSLEAELRSAHKNDTLVILNIQKLEIEGR